MKNPISISVSIIGLSILIALIAVASASNDIVIRGQVTDLNTTQFTYDASNFPGFYYDLNSNVGAEKIDFSLSNGQPDRAMFSDVSDVNGRGIVYTTAAQVKNFKFKPWGSYYVIGFLGDGYLAAFNKQITQNMESYGETGVPFLYDHSKETNILKKGLLVKVLKDDNAEMTITSHSPLKLAEGYELDLKSVSQDGNKAYLELSKDGRVVDSKAVQPSISNAQMGDKTYYYKANQGDTNGIITIAVHVKNAFRGTDENISTIDGILQLSDKPIQIKVDQQFDLLSIRNIDPNTMAITMDNKDNALALGRDMDTELMQNICVKTADQSIIDADQPLRYYIYKKISDPGTYEVRGATANLGMETFTWDKGTFAGFYYDIDKNIGTEQMTFSLSDATPSSAKLGDEWDANGMRGIVYTTTAQSKNFKFKPWGQYEIIGFLGDAYFAAYDSTETPAMQANGITVPYLYDMSKNRNLIQKEELSKVLIDDNKEQVIKKGSSLMLKDGYELALKGIDDKGHIYVELIKNGQTIDTKLVQPSIESATMADKIYYYKTNIGDAKEIATIAVHFKNSYRDEEQAFATVDGIWQISDTAISIKPGKHFDKMSIRSIDPSAMNIIMDNKGSQINLTKKKDIILMQNIHLKTADQNTIDDATPLRYYIYSHMTVESDGKDENVTPENEKTATNQTPPKKTVNEGI